MVTITMTNNNRYSLDGSQKALIKIYKKYKIKHPQAFFLRRSGNVQKGWDGCIDYVSETGNFNSGFLPGIYQELIDMGQKVEIIDKRFDFKVKPKMPKMIGDNKPRGYQKRAIESIIFNEIGGVSYPIGVEDVATNGGKTTLMAGIFLAYKRKVPAIILIKDSDLFDQMKRELPLLIPKEDLGFIRGKEINFNLCTVAMVQTLSPKVSYFKNQLAKFGICLVDEADEGESKTYKTIIRALFNTFVRVGLSGTIYQSKLKKHESKNMNLRSFFGDVVFKITKKEMVELGHSTKPVIRMYPGNEHIRIKGDYALEYKQGITLNKDRIRKGIKRSRYNFKLGRNKQLIVFKYEEHGELLYKMFKKELGNKYKIAWVHHKTKNRKQILLDFRDGKIDILIASFIVKRGKNFPLINYIQNQAGSDSQSTISQLMGRGERKDDSKKKFNMDDFFDQGHYLMRHSKHRLTYYKAEGFTVYEKYK